MDVTKITMMTLTLTVTTATTYDEMMPVTAPAMFVTPNNVPAN